MEMKVAPSAGPDSNFGLLHPLWPDLHSLAIEAQQNSEKLPAFTAIRLRSFSEAMVRHLFEHHALPMNSDETQLDRLRRLEKERLINRRVLGMLHTIRKLGNIAAHDKRPVVAEEARSLLEDAWSLASWFCRYLRPDLDWDAQLSSPPLGVTPVSGTFLDASKPTSEDQPTHVRSSVLVTRSDQSVRPPQARISLSDAYEHELNDDQQRCVLALLAFLSDDSQRVFLLKGFAGTGKTFLAAGLTEYLLSQGRMFSLAAPTGRAAKVIAKKTDQSARTIHSLIYDYSDMTEQTEDGEDGPLSR